MLKQTTSSTFKEETEDSSVYSVDQQQDANGQEAATPGSSRTSRAGEPRCKRPCPWGCEDGDGSEVEPWGSWSRRTIIDYTRRVGATGSRMHLLKSRKSRSDVSWDENGTTCTHVEVRLEDVEFSPRSLSSPSGLRLCLPLSRTRLGGWFLATMPLIMVLTRTPASPSKATHPKEMPRG